jgi:mycothiol synthase
LSEGYRAVRYDFEMARSLAEPVPDLPLPDGLAVRAVSPGQYRQLFDAMEEAFRDHWGWSAATGQDYLRWLNGPYFEPRLWQVGWDGDEVAGMVLNFLDTESNAKYRQQRGWTEPICVRRPWRKRGLAKALIARSLRLWQAEGMTEAALHVDTQNPNGALELYESMGYRVIKQSTSYEKSMA